MKTKYLPKFKAYASVCLFQSLLLTNLQRDLKKKRVIQIAVTKLEPPDTRFVELKPAPIM